jgi:hypothetical protein
MSLRIFPWLMGLTVVVEATTGILSYGYNINPYWVYHFGAPLLDSLAAYFFYLNIEDRIIKKTLVVVVAAYVITSLALTFFFYQLTDFPGLSTNLAGIIMIGGSLYVLLTLDPIFNIPIYKHPLAWICIGFIVFNTGTFFLNGIYNYLVESKSESRILIHHIINQGLNCFMYASFMVGLICSHRLKKFTQQ